MKTIEITADANTEPPKFQMFVLWQGEEPPSEETLKDINKALEYRGIRLVVPYNVYSWSPTSTNKKSTPYHAIEAVEIRKEN